MNPEAIIKENIWYIYGVFVTIFVLIIISGIAKRRGRIKVRVKTPLKEITKWRKPEQDGKTIVMRKKKKKEYGWEFSFSNKSLVPVKGLLGSHFAVDVFPEAPKAIEYDYQGKKTDQPRLTKKQAAEINRLNAFLARYSRIAKPVTSAMMWIIVILLIVNIVLQIFGMRGVRVG